LAKRTPEPEPTPIGDILRHQRIETLGKGLREMAAILDIAPAHLTDIEKGRRTPSEALLERICNHYKIDTATLRAGWSKLDESVKRIGTKNPTTAEKVPALLNAAENISAAQWDSLIEQAKRFSRDQRGRTS